ncbi:putative tricarboxylic transport membrane protein [Okibacterium sp. HSC-33S16]|uniref:tripartite tricarboxylate transporter TctB family protein n=1 Tax=Okibacterium sp. HSC-33S16 TaxID=2910965 RepID=UPI00209D04EF|nr:tripartite tricarboxylate transporter TctB family protein [Okibacterium sp. HSC-33S16]MCP2032591.1 putative tricarboxylic transport membrane protein [Okibacterium sp. HSC-33S16]
MSSPSTGASGTGPARPTAGDVPAASPAPRSKLGEYIFAALALALGIFVFVGAFSIRVPGAGTQVGPRVFPFLVGTILIVSAAMVVVDVIRGRLADLEEGEDIDSAAKTDWITLAKITAFVVAHIALIELIGWPFAAAVLFGGVAWSLGAKRWWMALVIGLALGLVIYVLFGGLLGLSLPSGPLLTWLDPLLATLRG